MLITIIIWNNDQFLFLNYFLQYSMSEQGVVALKQIEEESTKIKQCLDRFSQIEEKIEQTQIAHIKNKYQYELRTFHKVSEEHLKFREMYDNINTMVEQSNQMKEENSSIDFINKIMEETERRYNLLKESIQILRHDKEETKQELKRLKSILMKIKREYFELQRKQLEATSCVKVEEQTDKKCELQRTMFKIRSEKKASQNESIKIKPIPFQKLASNSSGLVERKISTELQLIDKIKEQFLAAIGININEYYKLSQKAFANQHYSNELIKKRQFKIKDKCLLTGIQNYHPTNNAVEVFKIISEEDKERECFMRLGGEQILDLIIRKNKVGQVLHLIEGEKKQIFDAYKEIKNTK